MKRLTNPIDYISVDHNRVGDVLHYQKIYDVFFDQTEKIGLNTISNDL